MSDSDKPEPESVRSDDIATRAAVARSGANVTIMAAVLSGTHKGLTKPMGGRMRIGKAQDNDLVLTDDTVSRHHCEIIRAPDGLHVRDLDSTNGTKIDGTRIREAMVQPGSVLKVGEVEIQFRPTVHKVEVLPSDNTLRNSVWPHDRQANASVMPTRPRRSPGTT